MADENFLPCPQKFHVTFGILCLQPQLKVTGVLKNGISLLGIGNSVAKQVSECIYFIYTNHWPLHPCSVRVYESSQVGKNFSDFDIFPPLY